MNDEYQMIEFGIVEVVIVLIGNLVLMAAIYDEVRSKRRKQHRPTIGETWISAMQANPIMALVATVLLSFAVAICAVGMMNIEDLYLPVRDILIFIALATGGLWFYLEGRRKNRKANRASSAGGTEQYAEYFNRPRTQGQRIRLNFGVTLTVVRNVSDSLNQQSQMGLAPA